MRKLDDDTAQTIDQQLKGEKAKLNAKEQRVGDLESKLKGLIDKKKEQISAVEKQFQLNQQIYTEYLSHLQEKEHEILDKQRAQIAHEQSLNERRLEIDKLCENYEATVQAD